MSFQSGSATVFEALLFYETLQDTHTHTLCLKKCPKFTHFLAHVISIDSKISCKYNFLKCLAFTYFIML